MTAVDLNKLLEQIKLPISLHTYISVTMNFKYYGHDSKDGQQTNKRNWFFFSFRENCAKSLNKLHILIRPYNKTTRNAGNKSKYIC